MGLSGCPSLSARNNGSPGPGRPGYTDPGLSLVRAPAHWPLIGRAAHTAAPGLTDGGKMLLDVKV